MTPRTPQVGDTITTAEELDALPVGSAVLAGGKDVWTHVPAGKYTHWLGIELSEDDHYIEPRQHWLRDAASERGVVILHLPGHPPRPEREVKAEALREVAGSTEALERARVLIENELIEWRDSRRFTLRRNGLAIRERDGSGSEIIRFGFEYGYAMALRAEADRIARGDL